MNKIFNYYLPLFLSVVLVVTAGFFWVNVHSAKAGFQYVRKLTIDHTKVPNTDQVSFPILVCANGSSPCNTSITGLNQTGGGAHVQNSNGYDIGFYTDSACTTKVTAWEMEKYTASTGEMIAWVNDGTLSHTVDTVFYMCYGDPSISTFQSTASNVWDSNFKLVAHLQSTSQLQDSTSNGNNGTASGSPVSTSLQIDGAVSFNQADPDAVNFGNNASLDSSSDITVSAWVKAPSYDGTYRTIIGKRNLTPDLANYGINYLNQTTWQWFFNTSGTYQVAILTATFNTGTTYHIECTFKKNGSNTDAACYVNGASVSLSATSLTGNLAAVGDPLLIGAGYKDGHESSNATLDEVRISNSARSADWAATDYNNQSSPSTFETFGTENTLTNSSSVLAINNITFQIKNATLTIKGN
jgi:plastocyanin